MKTGILLAAALLLWPVKTAGDEDQALDPSYAREGMLEAYLIVTDKGEELLTGWAEGHQRITYKNVDTADRGKFITVIIRFLGCEADERGLCNATVDYVAYQPDGSVYGDALRDGELWIGKPPPSPGSSQLSVDYLGLVVEATDPEGEYRLEAKVTDRVSGRSVHVWRKLRVATPLTGDPDWLRAFGYSPQEVHPIDIGDFGYPYVRVVVGDASLRLPFDTGNMAGVSVSSDLFNRLELPAAGSWTRRNSAGEAVATLRVSDTVQVFVLGRDLGPTRIHELNHPSLPGLVGPETLGGGHFTLDYASRKIAAAATPLPQSVPEFRKVPLIRSEKYPTLILVRGEIEGRQVTLQLDTGKSRCTVNPKLASELGLPRDSRGVAIRSLRFGDLSFEVPSAKEVDQTAIDPSLPEPILAGVGSDILSRFVWTVDYKARLLWIPVP